MVPTLVDVTLVKVTVVSPTTAAFLLIVAFVPSLLVTVTVTGLGGAAASVMLRLTWRSRPTVASLMVIAGAVTVAVTDCRLLGLLKPAGVVTLIVVSPAPAGSKNVAKSTELPDVKTAGLPTIVPAAVFELVTATFTA